MGRERPLNATATTTSEDIRQFREAVAGVLGTGGIESPPAPDAGWRTHWRALADLGTTGLCVPEDRGGVGVQPEVASGIAAELGAALHGSPFPGLTASAHALAAAPDADTRAAEALASIVSGERIAAFGLLQAGAATARTVDGAPTADLLVLQDPSTGNLVLLDDRSSWTGTPVPRPFDASRSCADVELDPDQAHAIPSDPAARLLFGLLLAADALGCTERALARAVAYARDREAFGRPIGGFQAVQHRLADHAVRVRGMSLLVQDASQSLGSGAAGAGRRVALAEASVSGGAGHVLHDLLQLTGAIGFTWEYGLHLLQRRVHHDARLAANPRQAVRTLAEIEGWTGGR